MILPEGNLSPGHRVPRGGRALFLGVALLLAAPSIGNWLRGDPAAPTAAIGTATTPEVPPVATTADDR